MHFHMLPKLISVVCQQIIAKLPNICSSTEQFVTRLGPCSFDALAGDALIRVDVNELNMRGHMGRCRKFASGIQVAPLSDALG